MSTRRDALRILGATSLTLPGLTAAQDQKEVESQPGHLHAGPPIPIANPSKPQFLQPHEFDTLESMAECIIPRTDTPGAKDAGAALLIHKAIVANPSLGSRFRAGLADLNAASLDAYGQTFVALDSAHQIAVLTPLSLQTDSPQGQFFSLVKNMTIDAYYKTEAGLKTELGWHGNVALAEFPGCDHPGHHESEVAS